MINCWLTNIVGNWDKLDTESTLHGLFTVEYLSTDSRLYIDKSWHATHQM